VARIKRRRPRCALALRTGARGWPIAIDMVRAESTRPLLDGDLLGRAAQMVAQMAQGDGEGKGWDGDGMGWGWGSGWGWDGE
jgi:hypothetical protein